MSGADLRGLILGLSCAAVLAWPLSAVAQTGYTPARLQDGSMPELSQTAVGGGEVVLELSVGPDGRVRSATPLRVTPPFTDLLLAAVRDWDFDPAEEPMPTRAGAQAPATKTPVASRVLVAAVFRPPAVNGPTLGSPARDVAAASSDLAFPLDMVMPTFPPSASAGGVVLLEARLDPTSGAVVATTVLHPAAPFDAAAQDAASRWRFRPASARISGAPTYVYLLFGFPLPVAIGPGGPGPGGGPPPVATPRPTPR